MLLKSYRKEIFRPECNPSFESLHCIAHLDQDISEVFPYLNAELRGHHFSKDPPSVTFKVHGKLITLHPREIDINALKDEEEADKILKWFKEQINDIWERRDQIEPIFHTLPQPKVIEILKVLPKTNCRECGQPTCMVFATQMAEGGRTPDECPELSEENRKKLEEYLKQFELG